MAMIKLKIVRIQCLKDSTVSRAFVLNVADLGSKPGIIYSPQSPLIAMGQELLHVALKQDKTNKK